MKCDRNLPHLPLCLGDYVFSVIYMKHHLFISRRTHMHPYALLSIGCTYLQHRQINEYISLPIPIDIISIDWFRCKIYKLYNGYLVSRMLQPLEMKMSAIFN
ncbi:hypothetical protein LINPERPRIM_LOCUS8572 [Linum perenne]